VGLVAEQVVGGSWRGQVETLERRTRLTLNCRCEELFALRVDTGRRREQEALDSISPTRFQHVDVD